MLSLLLLACSDYALEKDTIEPDAPSPDIVVTPDSLGWEATGLGCVDEQVVTVWNQGEGPLSLSGTWFEGGEEWSAELRQDTLGAGESVSFNVRFSPTRAGRVEGQVVVASDDPDEPEVVVPAEGVGAAEALQTDRFVQAAEPVDVLWVIDNSSSMGQEQGRVATAITSFFSWFTTLNLDYQMGVITTDVVNPLYSGRLVGSPAFITRDTPSAEAELAEAIAVGTDDMGDESGLHALQLALSEPVLSTENAGFLRSDARLAVIFLSDEPEWSAYDASHYTSFLQTVKSDPTKILVNGIVGDRTTGCSNTCDDLPQDAQPGDKYLDVIAAFGGVSGSICTCDLAPLLDEIGLATTRYIRSFVLSDVPTDPTSITVWVDGEEVEEGWTWFELTNEILFDTPPLNGSVVEVRYAAAISCE